MWKCREVPSPQETKKKIKDAFSAFVHGWKKKILFYKRDSIHALSRLRWWESGWMIKIPGRALNWNGNRISIFFFYLNHTVVCLLYLYIQNTLNLLNTQITICISQINTFTDKIILKNYFKFILLEDGRKYSTSITNF